VEYDLVATESQHETPLDRLNWADWDVSGDLLFARKGRLYRWEARRHGTAALEPSEAREVADLCEYSFTERRAPPKATRW